MICDLDENDYCARHQTIHVGRLKELALMDNEKGEQYRQLWDRQLKIGVNRPLVKTERKPCGCNKGK